MKRTAPLKRTAGLKTDTAKSREWQEKSRATLKRSGGIPPVSAKRKRQQVEYSRLRREYLGAHPKCQFPGCPALATDVHHTKGRGKYYLDKTTFCGLCRACHDWAHANPLEAKELGISVSRLGVDEP